MNHLSFNIKFLRQSKLKLLIMIILKKCWKIIQKQKLERFLSSKRLKHLKYLLPLINN